LTPHSRMAIVGVETPMRLITLLVTAILMAAPARAQEAESSSAAAAVSAAPDTKPQATLPVSLDKIRIAIGQPTSGPLQKAVDKEVDKQPTFRVEVLERQKIEELISSLDFKSGPTPAGGVYAFEQQRMLTPSVDNPLAQPYAAFNQGQLLTILVENLVGKYLAGKALDSITKAQRENAEAAARHEVEQAVADYCGKKPDNGAGLQLCTK
jgi:hypothetical protein